MRRTLIICALGLAAAGCFGDGDSAVPVEDIPIKESALLPREPAPGKVVVWERGPRLLQCEAPAVTLKQSAKKLINAGIAVSRSNCGVDGLAYPAMCGAQAGEILVHDIPESSLDRAMELGFRPGGELPRDWQRVGCGPEMHAIDVAQGTTHCVDLRNRVLFIQGVADPQERYTLLDQAGSCADASYRQVLYGSGGEDVLCSMMDTIAGPQKNCLHTAYQPMFDTIVANLAAPDLGLGAAYIVGQVYPVG